MVWVKLLANIALLVLVGTFLSRYADVVAEKTGLGRTWIGTVFLGAITSMPELATGIGAIFIAKSTNLASGDILGSCLFNILIFAFIVTEFLEVAALKKAGILLAGLFGALMISVAVSSIFLSNQIKGFQAVNIGFLTIPILFIYFVAMRLLFKLEKRKTEELIEKEAIQLNYQHIADSRAYIVTIFLGLSVIGLGIWLSTIGKEIAMVTGLGSTFIGTLFLAAATSMPEIIVTIGAIRLGAVEMAVANVFGSNIFNIAILGIEDVLYMKGNIWATFDLSNVFTGIGAIIMTLIAIISIIHPPRSRKRLGFNWQGAALIATYFLSVYLIYVLNLGT